MSIETQFLDRGDGTCKYYEEVTKRCIIYSERPSICQVDRQYKIRYSHQYTWNEYVSLNYEACKNLQDNANRSLIPTLNL